tara:strand:+ start:212 stop:514 length:303 start_codon:yes stop_codon:yes gene_type:complete
MSPLIHRGEVEIMKKIIFLLLILLTTSCATGTYSSKTGDNSNLDQDTLFCKSLARSKHPGYICKNPLMCSMEEVNLVLNDLTQYYAVFQNCMLGKGYRYQ